MLTLRTTSPKVLKHHKTLIQALYNSTTTQPAVKNAEEDYNKQLKQYEKLSNIMHRIRTKKPQRQPFVKNLMLGKFDTEILTYPQLEKEDIDKLEETIESVDRLVKQELSKHSKFDRNFLQNLSDYKLIGMQSSSFENGRECNISEYTKILETLSEHNVRSSLIHNEQLGVQSLIKYGSADLRKKYLEILQSGEWTGAFCMAEENLCNLENMCTKAALTADGKHWILSGDKIWVVNAESANYFIVFALTGKQIKDNMEIPQLTAFFVENDPSTITKTKYDINNFDLSRVKFENTMIPAENVLGDVEKGADILTSIIGEYRLSYGPLCSAISKKLVNHLHDYLMKETNDDNMLIHTDAIRGKVGPMMLQIYAMESMTYLTTGLVDSYENQDCELEYAIIKLFCSQTAHEIALTCQNIVGTPALEETHWCNQLQKEALKSVILHETNDNLKNVIALMGLKYAGNGLNDTIRALRNPLFNASTVWKKMWTSRRDNDDDPKLNLKLDEYVHPSLAMGAQNLEYCVHRLRYATELLFIYNGAEIVNKHMDLNRLADCMIDVYALTAVLGRASRSYCIGLQHSDFEMLMSLAFSNIIKERVQYNVSRIHTSIGQTNDENYRVLTKKFIKFKGWFFKHPLARNF